MTINTIFILKTANKFVSIFSKIDDPRRDLTKLHQLNNILLRGIISVICGADSWSEMELYAQEKEGFLRTFLELSNGIPSHDTFNCVFSAIDSQQLKSVIVLIQVIKQYSSCLLSIVKKYLLMVSFDGIPLGRSRNVFKKSSFDLANLTICSHVSAP